VTHAACALSVTGLTKSYDGVAALQSVDLDVRPGELLTLLGPSGSGKTTLLMSIAGFADPDAGRIRLDGRDITFLPPHRRGIGMVFQQYALFPHLSIAENVAYPLKVRRVPKAERDASVTTALRLVQLEAEALRRPEQLSGGQQQRVALARALVFRPPVLLMDEPLGALDRKLRAEMQIEIRSIQKSLGITTVYVTHDQEEALAISDRIAIVNRGRIEQIDSPARIYGSPASTFVADFIGDSNLFEGALAPSVDGVLHFRAAAGITFPVRVRVQTEPTETPVALVRPENVQIRSAATTECPHRGSVKQVVYMGSTMNLQIATEAGAIVLAKVNPGSIEDIPGIHQDIWFGWRAEDPVLVPASAPRPGPH
jgi:putative spermidine/putrescine transport system ATP-binding protein